MSEYEKLEYIHHALQEVLNGVVDEHMTEQALFFVEDIREKHFDKNKDTEWSLTKPYYGKRTMTKA